MLESRNLIVNGRRTSMRLEPSMWDALEDIARREEMTLNDLVSSIEMRAQEAAAAISADTGVADRLNLTSAVRTSIAVYYREAATPYGHFQAGHGRGEPFAGAPASASFRSAGRPDGDIVAEPLS